MISVIGLKRGLAGLEIGKAQVLLKVKGKEQTGKDGYHQENDDFSLEFFTVYSTIKFFLLDPTYWIF